MRSLPAGSPAARYERRREESELIKGERKKQDILSTAEEMFCKKGYEQTSIQDIIDRLNTSKGSFYHHFTSKEALLEGICDKRAAQIFYSASEQAERVPDTTGRLNIMLSGMIPFRAERLSFLLMLLPVFSLPEGRIVREYYCNALAALFRDPVCELIRSGNQNGELSCDDPENAADLILSLVGRLWIRITDLIIDAENRHSEPDLSECLRMSDTCRTCIERFLFIPYGSIELTDIPSLRLTIGQIHNHWVEI